MTVKSVIGRALPWARDTVRAVREIREARNGAPVATPFGFSLAGSDFQAAAGFEQDEVEFARGALSDVDMLVDVGANVGLYTLLAATAGVPVVAVEPLPRNLSYLYRNVRAAGAEKRVTVFPVAVSDDRGLLDLYGFRTGASLVPGWAGAPTDQTVTVPVHTLDMVFVAANLAGQRLLVKLDVEGAEAAAVRGGSLLLAADTVWLVEVIFDEGFDPRGRNSDYLSLFETFWGAGYVAEAVGESRRIERGDVERWLASGVQDFARHKNIVFRKG